MDLSALQSLPLSVRKQIMGLVESASKEEGGDQERPVPPQSKSPSREELRGRIRSSVVRGEKLCVLRGWLGEEEAASARADAQRLLAASGRPAGMMMGGGGGGGGGSAPQNDADAGGSEKWRDARVRGDRMLWLPSGDAAGGVNAPADDKHDDDGDTKEEGRAVAAVVSGLMELRDALMAAGADVGGRASFQLASYGGGGERYVRHRDRSSSCPLRRVTAIVYLNPGWDARVDGGQLLVYSGGAGGDDDDDGDDDEQTWGPSEQATVVAPSGGSIAVFDSALEHEVLPAFAERVAVTAWFSCPEKKDGDGDGDGDDDDAMKPPGGYLTATGASLLLGPRSLALDGGGGGNGLIFVSVASFRDPETAWTVRSLFEAAAAPERLRVGVVWQAAAAEAAANMALLGGRAWPWRAQVREVRVDWREATGPCRARHLAAAGLWAGEEFALQVDSHMRFAAGWDRDLLAWLAAAEARSEHGRAVLSAYPPGYEGEGPAAAAPADRRPTLLCASHFGPKDGLLRLRGRRLAREPADPVPSLFWAAGLSFSRAALLRAAPYSPALPLLFFGEEMLQLAHMWTRGWDVFAPPRAAAFHLWTRSHRPTFSSSVPQDPRVKAASQAAVRALLASSSSSASASSSGVNDDPFLRLGSVRSIEDFRRHVGVDFVKQEIAPWAKLGGKGMQEASFCCDEA